MTNSSALLLIDGSGFIFRAYHKMPPLTHPDGTPTGAVYGFTAMLLKLREMLPCSHAVVVFDAKGDTFRHALFPAYKAHRPPAPEDLIPQFPLVRHAAQALSLPIIEQSGMEADDIIATYALSAKAQGMEVCIVSSDKDLMQLMQDGIRIYDPMKNTYLTEDDVFTKFGVSPSQVADVQAIMGDSTDNVQGIKGIGAKGAAELIQQFGTLELMLQHANDIPQKKRRELVIEQADQARLSKQLVLLKTDCDGLPPIESCIMQPIDATRFHAYCREMNFTSLMRRVAGASPAPSTTPAVLIDKHVSPPPPRHYHLIQDMATLEHVIAAIQMAGMVAFDVETTGLDVMQAELVGISLCCEAGVAYYIPLTHVTHAATDDLFAIAPALQAGQLSRDLVLEAFTPLLTSPSIMKIGHNIKYDMHIMQRYGVNIFPIEDTMLLSYCLGAGGVFT
jgi:DNA polymerase I